MKGVYVLQGYKIYYVLLTWMERSVLKGKKEIETYDRYMVRVVCLNGLR